MDSFLLAVTEEIERVADERLVVPLRSERVSARVRSTPYIIILLLSLLTSITSHKMVKSKKLRAYF